MKLALFSHLNFTKAEVPKLWGAVGPLGVASCCMRDIFILNEI
jgi:hypothetical protein